MGIKTIVLFSAADRIRTCGLSGRSRTIYPAELQPHIYGKTSQGRFSFKELMVCSQADRRGYLRRRPAAQEPAVPICAAAAGVEYTIRCVLGPDAAVQGGWTTGKFYYNTPGAENQPYFAESSRQESSRQQSVRCGRSAQGPLCAVGALCKPPRRKSVRPNGGRAGGVPAPLRKAGGLRAKRPRPQRQ